MKYIFLLFVSCPVYTGRLEDSLTWGQAVWTIVARRAVLEFICNVSKWIVENKESWIVLVFRNWDYIYD